MLLAALSLLVFSVICVASCTKPPLCCQVTMLLAALSLLVLPGNHAGSYTEPPSGLLFGAVVFQRLQDKISHEAVRKYTRS